MAVTDNRLWAEISRGFRRRRNRALAALIADLGSPRVLDVGGHPNFWSTIDGAAGAAEIIIVNSEAGENSTLEEMTSARLLPNMTVEVGDACALRFGDGEFDLVVCNSVLEHVSGWPNIERTARELVRVGRHGWVQTPAYEFPLEVHYMRPFVHWLAEPARARLLRITVRRFRHFSPADFRRMFLFVQLLTRREMRFLFPRADIKTEWLLGFRKSHIAVW